MKKIALLSVCAFILLISSTHCASIFRNYQLFGKNKFANPHDHQLFHDHSQHRPDGYNKSYIKTNGKSRDFTAWMNAVNPEGSLNGIALLIQSINPVISTAVGNKWAAEITEAAKSFPEFCNSGDEEKDKQEFAAFLSIIGAETSFDSSNGFPCTKENGCPNCQACSYNSAGQLCDVDPNLQYYGRGPLQLSWNYNYADFSQQLYGDDRLLLNPTKLNDDTTLCWTSALWFWMAEHQYGGWCVPQAAWPFHDKCEEECPLGPSSCSNSVCSKEHWLPVGRNSPHKAIIGEGGMGEVINLINGGYDCCPSSGYFPLYGHTLYRVQWFASILQAWGAELPWSKLDPVPMKNCPLAENHINCSQLLNPSCTWNCCRAV
ncbi:hypothetical protein ABPG74_010657 [Tetrahymena malaccensis]